MQPSFAARPQTQTQQQPTNNGQRRRYAGKKTDPPKNTGNRALSRTQVLDVTRRRTPTEHLNPRSRSSSLQRLNTHERSEIMLFSNSDVIDVSQRTIRTTTENVNFNPTRRKKRSDLQTLKTLRYSHRAAVTARTLTPVTEQDKQTLGLLHHEFKNVQRETESIRRTVLTKTNPPATQTELEEAEALANKKMSSFWQNLGSSIAQCTINLGVNVALTYAGVPYANIVSPFAMTVGSWAKNLVTAVTRGEVKSKEAFGSHIKSLLIGLGTTGVALGVPYYFGVSGGIQGALLSNISTVAFTKSIQLIESQYNQKFGESVARDIYAELQRDGSVAAMRELQKLMQRDRLKAERNVRVQKMALQVMKARAKRDGAIAAAATVTMALMFRNNKLQGAGQLLASMYAPELVSMGTRVKMMFVTAAINASVRTGIQSVKILRQKEPDLAFDKARAREAKRYQKHLQLHITRESVRRKMMQAYEVQLEKKHAQQAQTGNTYLNLASDIALKTVLQSATQQVVTGDYYFDNPFTEHQTPEQQQPFGQQPQQQQQQQQQQQPNVEFVEQEQSFWQQQQQPKIEQQQQQQQQTFEQNPNVEFVQSEFKQQPQQQQQQPFEQQQQQHPFEQERQTFGQRPQQPGQTFQSPTPKFVQPEEKQQKQLFEDQTHIDTDDELKTTFNNAFLEAMLGTSHHIHDEELDTDEILESAVDSVDSAYKPTKEDFIDAATVADEATDNLEAFIGPQAFIGPAEKPAFIGPRQFIGPAEKPAFIGPQPFIDPSERPAVQENIINDAKKVLEDARLQSETELGYSDPSDVHARQQFALSKFFAVNPELNELDIDDVLDLKNHIENEYIQDFEGQLAHGLRQSSKVMMQLSEDIQATALLYGRPVTEIKIENVEKYRNSEYAKAFSYLRFRIPGLAYVAATGGAGASSGLFSETVKVPIEEVIPELMKKYKHIDYDKVTRLSSYFTTVNNHYTTYVDQTVTHGAKAGLATVSSHIGLTDGLGNVGDLLKNAFSPGKDEVLKTLKTFGLSSDDLAQYLSKNNVIDDNTIQTMKEMYGAHGVELSDGIAAYMAATDKEAHIKNVAAGYLDIIGDAESNAKAFDTMKNIVEKSQSTGMLHTAGNIINTINDVQSMEASQSLSAIAGLDPTLRTRTSGFVGLFFGKHAADFVNYPEPHMAIPEFRTGVPEFMKKNGNGYFDDNSL